jgi:hypothetical protein
MVAVKCIKHFSKKKSEGNRQFWIPRHRWEYNIKMDIEEIGGEGVD